MYLCSIISLSFINHLFLQDKREIELEQEAKLKAKYGMIKKPGGGSALLQKRLQKGVGV